MNRKSKSKIEYVFKGRRINLIKGYFKSPDGRLVYREVVEHPGSIVIIPIKNSKIIMLKQYRHAVGEWLYELPAGTLEENEDPAECARRELIEETGYNAREIIKLFGMYLSPGYSTEYMHVYLARNLEYVGMKPETSEVINVIEVDLNDINKWLLNGRIKDAKTIASLLYFKTFKSEIEKKNKIA